MRDLLRGIFGLDEQISSWTAKLLEVVQAAAEVASRRGTAGHASNTTLAIKAEQCSGSALICRHEGGPTYRELTLFRWANVGHTLALSYGQMPATTSQAHVRRPHACGVRCFETPAVLRTTCPSSA